MKALKNIITFFKNFLLLAIAVVLFIPLAVWGSIEMILHVFVGKRFWKALANFSNLFKVIATVIDTLGNVFIVVPANRVLITEDGYQFGNWRDTISYALGANEYNKTLTKKGGKLVKLLNMFEDNHCIKTYKNRLNTSLKMRKILIGEQGNLEI